MTQNRGKKNALLIASLSSFGLAITVIGFSIQGSPGLDQRGIYLLLLALFAGLGVLATRFWSVSWRTGKIDLFELPTWLTINVFLFLGVSGFASFDDPQLLQPPLNGESYWLNLALLYTLLGTASLWLGYRLDLIGKLTTSIRKSVGHLTKLSSGTPPAVHREPILWIVLTFYIVGVIARLVKLHAGAYGYLLTSQGYTDTLPYLQVLNYLDDLALLAVVVLALRAFRSSNTDDRPLSRLLLCGMLLSEVFFVFISGVKGPVVVLAILIFAVTRYRQMRFPWRASVTLVLFLILLFPINNQYRVMTISGEFDRSSLTAVTKAVGEAFSRTWLKLPLADNLANVTDTVTGRQASLIENVASIIRLTPSTLPYLDGEYYWQLPLSILIPRSFWTGKPVVHLGGVMTTAYLGKDIPSSSAVTPFGDLYMNFGLPGIIIGMLVLGSLYRRLYAWLRRDLSDPSIAVYLATLFYNTNYEADIPGLVQGFVQRFVVFYLATRLMYSLTSVKTAEAPLEGLSSTEAPQEAALEKWPSC